MRPPNGTARARNERSLLQKNIRIGRRIDWIPAIDRSRTSSCAIGKIGAFTFDQFKYICDCGASSEKTVAH
jgi:hypothetical protein